MTLGRGVRAGLAVVVLALGGCSSLTPDQGPPPGPTRPPLLYVALGADEAVGAGSNAPLREAWPQVLFRTGLPREAVLVNLGTEGATVSEVLAKTAPQVVALRPRLVTVWLTTRDLAAGITVADYERDLTALVAELRRDPATRVLLANAPDPNNPRMTARVDAYNAAIGRVAAHQGAVLVDLHRGWEAARRERRDSQLLTATLPTSAARVSGW